MRKVFYLCFYSDPEYMDRLVIFPSALSKIEYVVESLKKCGYQTNVVSVATSLKGRFKGRKKQIDEQETHTYLSAIKTKFAAINKVLAIVRWIQILCFLLKNVKKDDKVVIYHSLYHRYWLHWYKKLFRKDFILQIEDVYTSVHREIAHAKNAEWNLFSLTDKHICVNDFLKEQLNSRYAVVSYGSYKLPKRIPIEKGEKIRLVYAGVIEQLRNAAFFAVKAMEFLPESYELHILGFGTQEDIGALHSLIDKINETKDKKQVFYHGEKRGEEYTAFLQSCDIGLSTHVYQKEDLESADHTFPSKVLVYMANGLRVVAQDLDVLKESAIGELMSFYHVPEPEMLAKVIMQVDLHDAYDSRKKIEQLNQQFCSDLKALLEEI
ncbi:MAG: glycosyltransferase [Clostridia bacterium]|nr:glycosyltransferase [Clostridia bacterium]